MWKKECDLLIAQTMAFVQSVGSSTVDADDLVETRLPVISPDPLPTAVTLPDVVPDRFPPVRQSELRDEIRGRVAAFQARQQAFHRDREEYCNTMMAKVRASSEQAVKVHHQPPKD